MSSAERSRRPSPPLDAGSHVGWPGLVSAVEAARDAAQTSKGKASVDRIFQVVTDLRNTGEEVSVVTVGALCQDRWGGPQAGSIRNNRELRGLVALASAILNPPVRPSGNQPIEERILDEIREPELRAIASTLFAERRRKIHECDGLRNGYRRIKALAAITPEMATARLESLEELAALLERRAQAQGLPTFSDEERTACAHFLTHMGSEGLRIDKPSGAVVNKVGRTFALRGFITAIQKASSHG